MTGSKPLTNPNIKTAEPGDVLRDEKIAGLHMRVTKYRKAFYVYFRTRADVERRPKLGDFPTIGLDRARTIACEWLAVVAAGGDPVAGWQEQAKAPTVDELCDRFLEWCKARRKTRTHDDHKYFIDRFIRPKWGAKKIADVSTLDAESLHTSLSKTPVQANRLINSISAIFNRAEKWKLRVKGTNPTNDVERYKERARQRVPTPEEAKAVFEKLVEFGDQYPNQAAFMWLIIYTGARPSEIAAARPEQRQADRFVLAEHKTDRTGHDRVIHLPPQAVAVLDRIGKTNNGTITGVQGPKNLWPKILKATGLEGANLRLYDFRHLFVSMGLDAGLTLDQISPLMGHTSPATTKRYAHLLEHKQGSKATTIANAIDAHAGKNNAAEPERPAAADLIDPLS